MKNDRVEWILLGFEFYILRRHAFLSSTYIIQPSNIKVLVKLQNFSYVVLVMVLQGDQGLNIGLLQLVELAG